MVKSNNMYEYIKGEVVEAVPTHTIIEAGGIGYMIHTSLQSFTAMAGLGSVKLYLHHVQREDAQLLFGFVTLPERELFRLLITVSGIGTNTARIILSSYSVDELVQIIATGNVAALQSVKGIGDKTAQRVIVDLKKKVLNVAALDQSATTGGMESRSASAAGLLSQQAQEAIAALTTLGFTRIACEKVIKSLVGQEPEMSAESLIRQALSRL